MVFFSRDNLPRIKDGAYVININDNKSKGAQWFSLIFDRNTATYFDFFFKIKYIPQCVSNKIKDKSITHNIFRIESNDSIMCRFNCIAFI